MCSFLLIFRKSLFDTLSPYWDKGTLCYMDCIFSKYPLKSKSRKNGFCKYPERKIFTQSPKAFTYGILRRKANQFNLNWHITYLTLYRTSLVSKIVENEIPTHVLYTLLYLCMKTLNCACTLKHIPQELNICCKK